MNEQKSVFRTLGYSFSKALSVYILMTLLVIGFLLTGLNVYAAPFKPSTTVATQFGDIEGFVDVNGTLAWKGIPYGKPPVGDLRWTAPQDPDSWWGEGGKVTQTDPVACTQFAGASVVGDEDCLYLNVWRPNNNKKKLPVYFWIHGGSNKTGSALTYSGAAIADNADMVVVAIQYRLGPFGWLYHPLLTNTGDPLTDSGNFGTADVLKALTWVRDNIKAFGGNPDNVTIAGESAGAHDVMSMVISPYATGLFHRAISQSGGMHTQSVETGQADAETMIGKILAVDPSPPAEATAGYLRDKNKFEIMAGDTGARGAYEDGLFIPGDFYSVLASGDYNQVPIILGSNEDEMKFFLYYYGTALKSAWYTTPWYGITAPVPSGSYSWADIYSVLFEAITLDDMLPTAEDKALYQACGDYGSLNWRYNFVDAMARPMREHQNNVYGYFFKWDGEEGSDYDFIYGAAHATEIPFFFGGLTDIYGGVAFNPFNDTPGRKALSKAMMDYVAKFARSGNPNGSGLPVWQKWSNKEGKAKVIVFDANAEEAEISMISEEITKQDVDLSFGTLYQSLPAETRNTMLWFQWY